VTDDDDATTGDDRAPDASQQLLGLAREHRAADDLDTPGRAHQRSIARVDCPIGSFAP
jgi:hypothetical protein